MPIITDQNNSLQTILEGCRKGDSKSQELLYKQFYGYAMSVCLRYTKTRDEAVEVINDGFIKVFNNADKVDLSRSFKNWFRRIMVNTALDFYRQNHKHYEQDDIEYAAHISDRNDDASANLSYEELLSLVQRLSPTYRTVFSLYAIDGYSHDEIAKMLGFSVSASKSNLARARVNLREMLSKRF